MLVLNTLLEDLCFLVHILFITYRFFTLVLNTYCQCMYSDVTHIHRSTYFFGGGGRLTVNQSSSVPLESGTHFTEFFVLPEALFSLAVLNMVLCDNWKSKSELPTSFRRICGLFFQTFRLLMSGCGIKTHPNRRKWEASEVTAEGG